MRALAAIAIAALAAGCFGMCGPHVGSVEVQDVLDARFSDGNQTRVRDALRAQGFAVTAPAPGSLHAVRGDLAIDLHADVGGNRTDAWMRFDVPDREFRDSEGGFDDAEAYVAQQAARVAPEAQAAHDLLAAALGVASRPVPAATGGIGIC